MPTVRKYIRKRRLGVALAVIVWLAVIGAFAAYLILDLFKDILWIKILFAVVIPTVSFGLLGIILVAIQKKKELKALIDDNEYRFGKETYFYDQSMFIKKVNNLHKYKFRKQECYLITFVVSPKKELNSHNPYFTQLNGCIADYFIDTFSTKKMFGKHRVVYCFARDHFTFATFMPLEKTIEVVDLINRQIFELVKTKDIKIFVSPHFGIEKISCPSFSKDYNQALVALNYAERHFEEYAVFSKEMVKEANVDEILEIEKALEGNQFVVYYQPKFSLKTKEFVGAEALIRWNHPQKGILGPGKFIEKAELGGLIHDIDLYVFKKVISDLKEQKKNGKRVLPVSINFSLYEFYFPNFIDDLIKLVYDANIQINLLEIEITETTSQASTLLAVGILKKLKDYGFKISMDDFGSGFSNLLELNTLPIDTLKIDKSFIDGIASDRKTAEIVKCIIAMCKANGLESIAEGVDSKQKVDILSKANCDVVQGFYYAQPMPLDKYLEFLEDNDFEKKGSKK